MKMTKCISWFMIAVFSLTIVCSAAPAVPTYAAAFSDTQGQWASPAIQKMADQGIVTGMPDGSFKPDNSVSRAEFAVLVVKAFKLDNPNGKVFNDTSAHWANDYITVANACGIVKGYSDTKFGPDDTVTREQMAVIITKAAKLTTSGKALDFNDNAKVSNWAKDAVAIASAQKVMAGFPDGSFQPQAKATRAQAVMVINNAFGITTAAGDSKVYDTAGTYGPADVTATIDGNVRIKAGDVTLQNTVINGDLTIDKAVGEGTVTLKAVSVKGNTYINGGGSNSVYFVDSQTGKTYVKKDSGPVHIMVSGTSAIGQLVAQSGANLEETNLSGKGFGDIVVDRQSDGTFTLNIAGVNVQSLTVISANITIVTNANTRVDSFIANAAVSVTGDGTISTATINASGVNFAKAPTTQIVATGVSAPTVGTTGTGNSSGDDGSSTVPVKGVTAITGRAQVGRVLTAGKLTPVGAIVSYQWTICDTIDGTYTNIAGATANKYTPVAGDVNKFIKVAVTGTGIYTGIITSAIRGPVKDINAPSILGGWVRSTDVISGANLALYTMKDSTNQAVYEQVYLPPMHVTSDFGSFMITVENLPADFRIAAQGGICEGGAFTEELTANYQDFDPENSSIYINIVTTMVSVYLDKHPGVTLDEGVKRVKGFLKIPEWLDIGSGLQGQIEYFSPGVFVSEAGGSGKNIRQYIEQMVAEMDGGEGVTHPFPGQKKSGELQNPAGLIASNLAAGAAQYAGSHITGWGLGKMGEWFDGPKGPDNELRNQITKMQGELLQISQQLNDLDLKMTAMLNEIKSAVERASYDEGARKLMEVTGSIKNIREKMTAFVTDPPKIQGTQEIDMATLNTRKKEIIDLIHNQILGGNEDLINNVLVGDGSGVTPLLKQWSKVVKNEGIFLGSRDSERVQAQLDYYDTLQLWLAELLVEYYHATEPSTSDYKTAVRAVEAYNTHIKQQQALLKPPIPATIMIEKTQSVMIYTGRYCVYSNGQKTIIGETPWYGKETVCKGLLGEMEDVLEGKLPSDGWTATSWELVNLLYHRDNPRKYLEDSGWTVPLQGVTQFGIASVPTKAKNGKYTYHDGYLDIDTGEVWIRNPEYEDKLTNHHWFFTRKMGNGELDKYFW